MRRTFVDAGVLIAAARGQDGIGERALHILEDPGREFVASAFLRLEVLPKALYNKRAKEAQFYEEFFRAVSYWATDTEKIIADAEREATKYGLGAIDALHVAAAASAGATELITTERLQRSIYRAQSIKVTSIRGEAATE